MSICMEHLGFEPEIKGPAILLLAPVSKKETTSGIQLPDSYRKDQEIGTAVGLVLAIGNNAFKGKDHFATYECKVGDWVEYSIYERQPSSIRLKKGSTKPICYYINDERILSPIKEENLKYYLDWLKD